MLLMLDNYDSFVFNLVRYFEELGEEVIVYRNDKVTLDIINNLNINGIIISPGPKTPKESGICLEVIDKFKDKLPILGICLGHQCIAHYFGSEIIRGKEPVHGKVSQVIHNNNGIFKEVKNPLKVTRYHSLIVNDYTLPRELEVTCKTQDNIIMGIQHKKYHIYGVQFHPEAEMTEEGHKILNNFIDITEMFKGGKSIED